MTDNDNDKVGQPIEALDLETVIERADKHAGQHAEKHDISDEARVVLAAAHFDHAIHGEDTYDPARASNVYWTEDVLRDACEELVDAWLFERDGDVYRVSDSVLELGP